MLRRLKEFAADDSGATAIEYGLISAIISIAMITALDSIQAVLIATFNSIAGKL